MTVAQFAKSQVGFGMLPGAFSQTVLQTYEPPENKPHTTKLCHGRIHTTKGLQSAALWDMQIHMYVYVHSFFNVTQSKLEININYYFS